MLRWDHIDLIHDQTKSGSHINYRCIHSFSRGCGKYQAHRIGFATDRKRMDLRPRLFVRDRWTHLQHVSAQHLCPTFQVIGVVLHERNAAFESVTHHFRCTNKSRCFPVAFSAKAIAIGHQALDCDALEYAQTMEILKGVVNCDRTGFVEKLPKTDLDSSRVDQILPLTTTRA